MPACPRRTASRSLDLQRDALLAEGVDPDRVYEDHAFGAKNNRPGLEACLRAFCDGDVLIVWKLDRLGRNLAHLVGTVQDLSDRGVGLRVLASQGAHIDGEGTYQGSGTVRLWEGESFKAGKGSEALNMAPDTLCPVDCSSGTCQKTSEQS